MNRRKSDYELRVEQRESFKPAGSSFLPRWETRPLKAGYFQKTGWAKFETRPKTAKILGALRPELIVVPMVFGGDLRDHLIEFDLVLIFLVADLFSIIVPRGLSDAVDEISRGSVLLVIFPDDLF